MSMRSIVEFNHDYAHRIEDEPATFAGLLTLALKSGGPEQWERLEHFGVRRAVMTHHSADRKVVANGYDYPLP
jgi:hypothetical protein